MKGISTIIATILLVVIAIGLASSAYVFLSTFLKNKMAKTISILGSSCNGTHITLVVSNDGTETINPNDIKVYVENQYVGTFGKSIDPQSSEVNSTIPAKKQNAPNHVLLVSPSNQVDVTVWC